MYILHVGVKQYTAAIGLLEWQDDGDTSSIDNVSFYRDHISLYGAMVMWYLYMDPYNIIVTELILRYIV